MVYPFCWEQVVRIHMQILYFGKNGKVRLKMSWSLVLAKYRLKKRKN